jgi:hypothetical protein
MYSVGRNGMHRYNNEDHSMLAANSAVSWMINGSVGKQEIWAHQRERCVSRRDWRTHLNSRLRSRHEGCASRTVV